MRTVSSNHELINGVIDDHQNQTTGLLFDDEGKTIGAWMLIHYAEPGFYLVTETSMRGDWVPETVVNPRQLIFDLEGDEIDLRRPSGAACSTLQGGGEHRLGRATL